MQASEEYDGELTKRGIPTELNESSLQASAGIRTNKLSPSKTQRTLNCSAATGRQTPNTMMLSNKRISPQYHQRRMTYRGAQSPSDNLSKTMPQGDRKVQNGNVVQAFKLEEKNSFLGAFRQNSINNKTAYGTNAPQQSNRLHDTQKQLTSSMENLNLNSENKAFSKPKSKVR